MGTHVPCTRWRTPGTPFLVGFLAPWSEPGPVPAGLGLAPRSTRSLGCCFFRLSFRPRHIPWPVSHFCSIMVPCLLHGDPVVKSRFWGGGVPSLFPPAWFCCVPAPPRPSALFGPRGWPFKHPCCPRNDIGPSTSPDTRILGTPKEGPFAPATIQERAEKLSKGFPRIQGCCQPLAGIVKVERNKDVG